MGIREDWNDKILIFDGGMGSLLQGAGLKPGELPETWNIKHPEVLVKIHEDYLNAGANIILSNTFGANRLKYNETAEFNLDEIVDAAMKNARTAVEHCGRGYVALDLGPTGRLLKPMGDLDFEEAVSIYTEVVKAGVRGGADLILIETMSDTYELKAAVLAAKENSDLPIFATTIFDGKGKLLTGGTPKSVVALLEGLGVDALGINCGLGPVQMKPIVEELLRYASIPVVVNPNAGLPRSEGGKTVYDIDPPEFVEEMKGMLEMGVSAVGGCCGTTPEHIRLLAEMCKGRTRKPIEPKNDTLITSYASVVEMGTDPVIIGERINPTGKSKFKQALRIYNGKALINSVNGKQEVMDAVFPLVKHYGGTVVALTIDEEGIPATADGRMAIARKICAEAEKYGIQKKDIVIDALCMTISSEPTGALVTLETVRRVRQELGCNTILGVSNISFGLPQREIVNSNFFTMAMQSGLTAAIINPNSAAMMRSYYSYRALAALDEHCGDYIEQAARLAIPKAGVGGASGAGAAGSAGSGAPAAGAAGASGSADTGSQASGPEHQLTVSVERGLKEQAASAAGELLKTMDSLTVINSCMIPALDKVGKGFEAGTVFLPQLLMSAEAAKSAFEVIKNQMESSGEAGEKKDKIVLATVKGDIHDIGKNIVKVLLENYSYDVLDLGKDVAPEAIVEETIKNHVRLVGLSALMTTTVPSMEETIKQLRKEAPWAKVMVGGAVLTQEYADMIGADAYCRDAMASVNYAQQVLV